MPWPSKLDSLLLLCREIDADIWIWFLIDLSHSLTRGTWCVILQVTRELLSHSSVVFSFKNLIWIMKSKERQCFLSPHLAGFFFVISFSFPQTWFKNRRFKWRKELKMANGTNPPSSPLLLFPNPPALTYQGSTMGSEHQRPGWEGSPCQFCVSSPPCFLYNNTTH